MTATTTTTTTHLVASLAALLLLALLDAAAGAVAQQSTFASLAGVYAGVWRSRVGVVTRQGSLCLDAVIEQPYELVVESSGYFERRFGRATTSTVVGGASFDAERADYVEQGTFDFYDAASGIVTFHLGADLTRSFCAKLTPSGSGTSRTLTEVRAFATDAGGASSCVEASFASLDAPLCSPLDAESRRVNVTTIVDVASLSASCLVSAWSVGVCSQACGGGTAVRTRTVLLNSAEPSACPPLESTTTCNVGPCASRDTCEYTPWSAWSTCSVSCGDGTVFRTRSPTGFSLQNPLCRSKLENEALPPTVETQPCFAPPCNANTTCVLSQWSAWSDCSQRCKATATSPDGFQTRYRTIQVAPGPSAAPCQSTTENQVCGSTSTCAMASMNCVNCKSATLLPDTPNWCRCCNNAPTCALTNATIFDRAGCNRQGFCTTRCLANTDECDGIANRDCVMSPWSEWSACTGGACSGSTATANGTRSSWRIILRRAYGTGAPCGESLRTEPCPKQCVAAVPIPGAACRASEWSAWSTPCACGGQMTRTRTAYPDEPSPECATVETQPCPMADCKLDCTYGPWSVWSLSQCSATCGGGLQTRTREIAAQPNAKGRACSMSDMIDGRDCNTQPCPVDCRVSRWSAYGPCSTECGGGTQTATLSVLTAPVGVGAIPCPAMLTRSQPCNTEMCAPGQCGEGDWSSWAACSAPCGGGTTTRTRNVPAMCGSNVVPSQSEPCNDKPCPMLLESFDLIGLKLKNGVDVGAATDAAATSELARVLGVDAQRLSFDAPGDMPFDTLLRVRDAVASPALFITESVVAKSLIGALPSFESASVVSRSGYALSTKSERSSTLATTPTPTTPTTTLAPATTMTTTEAPSTTTTTAPAPATLAIASESGFPVWAGVVIGVVLCVIVVVVIGVIISCKAAREAEREESKRDVFGTVSRTENLVNLTPSGSTAAAAFGGDDSSGDVDEGSEIREFRRQQQRRRHSKDKDGGSPIVSKTSSRRDGEDSANDNKPVSRVADAHVASTASFDKIAESATKLDD